MQKYRFKFFLFVLVAATIYAACRKTDSQTERPLSTNQHSRFFEANRSSDPFEKALVNFIRKEYNGSSNLDKVIKQIGYPRWNKAITLNKQAQVFLETEDSSSITYIPFVRDSQNFVNASLVVNINSEDTTFGFFCDWQYAGLERGSATTDSTAEHYALFFMAFDKQVFGHKEFKVTDNTLFADHPLGAGEEYRKIHFRPQAGNPLIETNSAVVCFDLIVCGSPTNSHCTGPNGCDFANCYSPGTCYTIEVCFGVVGDGSSEGPLGNDLPPTGGGSGGGGNGGPPTPSECPQGPVTPGTVFTDIDFICGPGWVPVPIGLDEPPNPFPPYIFSNLIKPCFKTALNNLSGGSSNTFFRQVYNTFDTSTNLHLFFTEAALDSAYGSITLDTIPSGPLLIVKMDTTSLLSCSQEWMAYIFIHEIAHSGMYANITQWDTANSQHIAMAGTFLNQMASALMTAYPALPEFDAYAMCFAGFYNGVEGSPTPTEIAFSLLIAKKISQKFGVNYNDAQLANFGREYTENGTKGIRNACN